MIKMEERDCISHIGLAQKVKLFYSKEQGIHILVLPHKYKDFGVSCYICGTPINKEYIYYCNQDKIFMHKNCLTIRHKVNSVMGIEGTKEKLHFDRKVIIKYEEVKQ